MKYQLPPLAYDFGALAPFADAQTMKIHYNGHHAGYVEKLNSVLTLIKDNERLASLSLEDLIADIRMLPEEIRQEVRNQGGGHLNHSLFWAILSPGKGGEPTGTLREVLDTAFGNFTRFKEEFARTALARFGSGWAWLCLNHQRRLEIFSTPNQDSPIMLGCRPILGLDVWEHAYYLTYQNRRAEYIQAWWNVVNWEKVAQIYAHRMEVMTHSKQ